MNSAEAGPAVALQGLRVVRGGRLVLDDVTLEVPRGTVAGLLGPSGCGKSTLMRALVGVQVVAGGEVQVLGRTYAVDPLWQHRLVRGEVDLRARRIRFYTLRRRAPDQQPLVHEATYVLPQRAFSE